MPSAALEAFFKRPAEEVARELVGCTLLLRHSETVVGGIITETEAYTASDPASHSFKGPSVRNAAMFGPPGTLYVYFIYGKHYCLNIVTGNHDGQAVLLRSMKPTVGIGCMQKNRGNQELANLTNGPGKLAQALGVTPSMNHQYFSDAGFTLQLPSEPQTVVRGSRIGISKATEKAWNFRLFQQPIRRRTKT